MTLLSIIEELIHLDYSIEFTSEIMNVGITLKKEIGGKEYIQRSQLPLPDHFYESKLVDCIAWMHQNIKSEIK